MTDSNAHNEADHTAIEGQYMQTIEKDYETYLATVAEMLTAEDMDEAASLLRMATTRMVETGYDNWNGGTTIWTIYLTVPPATYARVPCKLETIEAQINKRLKDVLKQFTDDWCSVSLAPLVEPRPEWRETRGSVSRESRQNIIDGFMRFGVGDEAGTMPECEWVGQ